MEAFNENGDINILNSKIQVKQQQNKEQYKHWEFCSVDELLEGYARHTNFLKKEIAKRLKRSKPLLLIAIAFGVVTAILNVYFEQLVNPMLVALTAFGTLTSLFFGMDMLKNKSEFKLRQEATLKEITGSI